MDKVLFKLKMLEALDQVIAGLTTMKTLTLEVATHDETSEEDTLQLLAAVKSYRASLESFKIVREAIQGE